MASEAQPDHTFVEGRPMRVAVFVSMLFGVRRPTPHCPSALLPQTVARSAEHDNKTEALRASMARDVTGARLALARRNLALAEAAAALLLETK